jgi:hypothetical protein
MQDSGDTGTPNAGRVAPQPTAVNPRRRDIGMDMIGIRARGDGRDVV